MLLFMLLLLLPSSVKASLKAISEVKKVLA